MMKIRINHATAAEKKGRLPPAPAESKAKHFRLGSSCTPHSISVSEDGTESNPVQVSPTIHWGGDSLSPQHSLQPGTPPSTKTPATPFVPPSTLSHSPSQSNPVKPCFGGGDSLSPQHPALPLPPRPADCGNVPRLWQSPAAALRPARHPNLKENSAIVSIQMAQNRQSRRIGEHTRPGCRFPRPRGKPSAPGHIKRLCKVRAHYGEVQDAFRHPIRHSSALFSAAVQPSQTHTRPTFGSNHA